MEQVSCDENVHKSQTVYCSRVFTVHIGRNHYERLVFTSRHMEIWIRYDQFLMKVEVDIQCFQ